jgi:hypothetical protein
MSFMNKSLANKKSAGLTPKRQRRVRRAGSPSNRFHTFLRRLRAGGRSNMYGAIPYLMHAFSLDREAAFRVVCEWVDQEAAADPGQVPVSPRA